jgi:hypothetical protein
MKSKILFVVLTCSLLNSGCKRQNDINSTDNSEDKSPVQWMVTELTFTSSKTYGNSFNEVDLDVIFTHTNGIELRIPAFWDNGSTWKVRFAPTLTGNWTYKTICSDTLNTGLNKKTGSLTCSEYTGKLDIYKHGFIRTSTSTRYFSYDDGTPFFYLGDTHASMPEEQFETSGISGIASQFKYIADKRVEQGFTVYHSEPIGAKYNLSDGFTNSDLFGFRDLDKRFKYLADIGLVHANAQLFFASELGFNRAKYSDAYLEKLCRYWVARYGAYPVMWTTGQEVDNDFYHGRMLEGKDMNPYFDVNTNPWKLVAAYIHKYDAYKHPQTAHQEFAATSGDGTVASNSSFRDLPGHSWYAVQWSPAKNAQLDFNIPKDFWFNGQGKPAVNYEGLFDHLWTLEFGARMQGWTAYLNGMFGSGYGAEDIWLYNSTYDIDKPTERDGIVITVADKQIKWHESVNLNSAYQVGYMHKFFNLIEWWTLIPRFDDSAWFSNNGSWYSIASNNNDLYVAYFYNNTNRNTGTLKNLANTEYSVQWYNPIKDKFDTPVNVTITNGSYIIGRKPDNNDWVLLMKKI